MDRLYFAEELSERYRVSVRKAREIMRTMPSIRIGNKRAISEGRLMAWEKEQADALLEGPTRKGMKLRTKPARVVHLEEMRCPTRRELREMEARTKAAR